MIRLAEVEFGCTVGYANSAYVITAGHCGARSWRGNPAYLDYSVPSPIGLTVFLSQRPDLDYGVIRLNPGFRGRSSPLSRRTPQKGDRLCKLGRVTGWTCGVVREVTDTQIFAELPGAVGDSGSLAEIGGAGVGILRGFRPHRGMLLPVWSPGEQLVFTRLDAITDDMTARGLLPGRESQ